MSDPFFITGLPRTRTAWMAAFLTSGDVFCYHEFIKQCRTRSEFYEGMYHPDYRVGNSDSGLMFTDFQSRFPNSKTVIIERDPVEVIDSLDCIYELDRDKVMPLFSRLNSVEGLRVSFDSLDQQLPDICGYLGIRYDKDRHDLFSDLNIQTMDLEPHSEAYKVWLEE